VAIFELEKLTWEDVEKLDRSKTIVFLPISPLEEHGPQLPVGTDFMAAREMAAMAVETLEKQDPSLYYLVHPGIPMGCASITADFAGTISVGGKALMRVVYDTGASLAKHGFKYVVVSNHHYEPEHVKAILTAGSKLWKRYRMKLTDPLATAAFSSDHPPNSSGLDLAREMHADMEETSFIKFKHPELLRELYKDLPSVHLRGLAIRYVMGMNTLRKMGAARGYVGSPALATSEYGREYFEARAKMIAESAMKVIGGEKLPEMSLEMKLVLKVVRLG
jgi:creatinine amidohydrolase